MQHLQIRVVYSTVDGLSGTGAVLENEYLPILERGLSASLQNSRNAINNSFKLRIGWLVRRRAERQLESVREFSPKMSSHPLPQN